MKMHTLADLKKNFRCISYYGRCGLAAPSVGNKVAHNKEFLKFLTDIFGELPELEKLLLSVPKPEADSSSAKPAAKEATSVAPSPKESDKKESADSLSSKPTAKEATSVAPTPKESEKKQATPKEKSAAPKDTKEKSPSPNDTKKTDPSKPTDKKK